MVCKTPHSRLHHSSISLVAFFSVLACVPDCAYRDKPSWRGQFVCARIDNQQSHGEMIARVCSFC
jgi:hypothetical protein